MTSRTLTSQQQRKSLSGMKKTKRLNKNLLCTPEIFSPRQCRETHEGDFGFINMLKRLLSESKLPPQHKSWHSDERGFKEKELSEMERSKRKQLCIGVNSVMKGVKQNIVAAVLLSSNILPVYMKTHISMLCKNHGVPVLCLSNLPDLVTESLGFPCIALGFKKLSDVYKPVIEYVSTQSEDIEVAELTSTQQNILITEGSSEAHKQNILITEGSSEPHKQNILIIEKPKTSSKQDIVITQGHSPPFQLLTRVNNQIRVFNPEQYHSVNTKETLTSEEYIPVANVKLPLGELKSGISSSILKKAEKNKFPLDSHEVIPKKKVKKDWVIDKIGTKSQYKTARLMKMQSNVNRKNRNHVSKERQKL